jgi:ribosomal protein S18 acetylase RimI-like enzyme
VPDERRPPEVRRALADDLEVAAEALAAAFYDDPAWIHLMPDAGDRAERLLRFFSDVLSHADPAATDVWVTDDGSGAAVWKAPGRWSSDPLETVRAGPSMWRVFGRRLPLATRTLMRVERRHPRRPGHWYLQFLGVVPTRQGQGLGSRLMGPLLGRLDVGRLPAFLEASTDRSRALYERHGFDVTATFNMPGRGPLLRQMWRDPR